MHFGGVWGGGRCSGSRCCTVVAASNSAAEVHELVAVAFLVAERKMIIPWQTVHLLFDCFLSSLCDCKLCEGKGFVPPCNSVIQNCA